MGPVSSSPHSDSGLEFAEWSSEPNESEPPADSAETGAPTEPTEPGTPPAPTGAAGDASPLVDETALDETIVFEEMVLFEEVAKPLSETDIDSDGASETAGGSETDSEPEPEPITLELADGSEASDGDEPLPATTRRGGWGGLVASTLFHVWLIFTLASAAYHELPDHYQAPLLTEFTEDTEYIDPVKDPVKYELADPKDRDLEVKKVVRARSVGMVQVEEPEFLDPPKPLSEIISPEVERPPFDLPQGREVSDSVIINGSTGEGPIEIESALDRITWEVANHLLESRVLLIWVLDGSGSLIEQREKVAERLERVYGELDALERDGQIPRREEPLLTGVVGFGQKTVYLTDNPTPDFEEVRQSIVEMPTDGSGRENIFGTVAQVLHRWGPYRSREDRQVMMVIVTDESGDDFGALEPAIKKARYFNAKTYVVGPAAVFGRRQGYVEYVAPEDGETYKLPVDLGPETPMISRLQVPYWHDGPNYDYLSSGFGPYGLARLVRETGGIYFQSNMTTMTSLTPIGSFEDGSLKPFEPDYSFASPAEYLSDIDQSPLRRAVWLASKGSEETEFPGTPPMQFLIDDNNFREAFEEAQRQVAITSSKLDRIGSAFPPNIEGVYQQEPSARWRMSFDLAYGRLLAMRVRTLEYNMACAEAKTTIDNASAGLTVDEVIFEPSMELNYAPQARRWEKEARKHLLRVLDEAPGTPWATLAARELRHPMGLRIKKLDHPEPPPVEPTEGNRNPGGPRIQLAPDPKPPRPKRPEPPPKPKPVLPKL